MRKARKNTATRQVIHIVGEGLTELFYFSHLKKILGYRYSISPRLFENNSIEKIDNRQLTWKTSKKVKLYNSIKESLQKRHEKSTN